jgi:hypothetical protein
MPNLSPSCKLSGCEHPRRWRSHFCSNACLFWSKFDRVSSPTDCWIWTGSVNPSNGYGDVSNSLAGGKRTSAHRHAYRLTYGDPCGMSVLHRCDTRLCANPAHLFTGTAYDNWLDSIAKGRQPVVVPGEANGSAKLTTAEVRAIRRFAGPAAVLAKQHGVDWTTIRRETWRHVPDEEPVAEMAAAEFVA